MSLCYIDPPPVLEDPKELINNLKLKLKSTKAKSETKIDEKIKKMKSVKN